MKTSIDNNQRKFLVQSQGFGSQKDIFCNLEDIPFILREAFTEGEEYKIFEFWNRKLTRVSKKHLIELYEANKVNPKQWIKTIDITGLQWFDKVNGNSYFAARVLINAGYESERTVKVPYQYGYGDTYITESLHQLETDGLLQVGETIYGMHTLKNMGIIVTSRKHTNCKKSELKNI